MQIRTKATGERKEEDEKNKKNKKIKSKEHLKGFKGQRKKIVNTEKRMLAKEKNTRNW